jgi:hypothetical protein
MKLDEEKTNRIPPIVAQYVTNCFDPNISAHVRQNYRDILDSIRELCNDAVKEFDKKNLYNKTFRKKHD